MSGSCFVKERDDLDSEVDLMATTKDNNDTVTFCHNISRAMLLWEDHAYCWQVSFVNNSDLKQIVHDIQYSNLEN